MPCVNHPEVEVQSYCQQCGKALCAACVRTTPTGQILCEQDLAATANDPSKAYWQPVAPFPVPPPPGTPNPAAAAVLGLIPGVGAMYNGQLFKGLIHVVIFAVIVSITDHLHVFGFFIPAWVLYQSFEAYHTAKARRDGTPLPDPFGLNEVGSWFNFNTWNSRPQQPGQPVGYTTPPPGTVSGAAPFPNQTASGQTVPGTAAGTVGGDPASAGYATPFTGAIPGAGPIPPYPQQPPYGDPYQGAYSGQYGGYQTGPIPPVPPPPPDPNFWHRREPIWAFVLIGLGVIFLLQSLNVVEHAFHYAWPVFLIALGAWLIIRRMGYLQGGPK